MVKKKNHICGSFASIQAQARLAHFLFNRPVASQLKGHALNRFDTEPAEQIAGKNRVGCTCVNKRFSFHELPRNRASYFNGDIERSQVRAKRKDILKVTPK